MDLLRTGDIYPGANFVIGRDPAAHSAAEAYSAELGADEYDEYVLDTTGLTVRYASRAEERAMYAAADWHDTDFSDLGCDVFVFTDLAPDNASEFLCAKICTPAAIGALEYTGCYDAAPLAAS